MKQVKTSFILIFLQFTYLVSAQSNEPQTTFKVQNLEITIDDLEELKRLDWDEYFSVFSENAPKDSVVLGIQYKDLKASKNIQKVVSSMSIRINGITENLEDIKANLRKGQKAMIKILETN